MLSDDSSNKKMRRCRMQERRNMDMQNFVLAVSIFCVQKQSCTLQRALLAFKNVSSSLLSSRIAGHSEQPMCNMLRCCKNDKIGFECCSICKRYRILRDGLNDCLVHDFGGTETCKQLIWYGFNPFLWHGHVSMRHCREGKRSER